MHEELLFQHDVAGITLEITSEHGDARATVTYPFPDPRFERGGFPIAVRALTEIATRLMQRENLRALFIAELNPCTSEEIPPDAPLPLEDLGLWLEAQRAGTVGAIEPTRGYWLAPRDGMATLNRLLQPLGEASAEASRLRLLLLEGEGRGARGWDLAHADGISTIGRFRVEIDEDPAPLDPEDVATMRQILGEVAAALTAQFTNGQLTTRPDPRLLN